MTGEAQAACTKHVYLPMRGIVESLNLAVTVGIVLAEVTRQRVAAGMAGSQMLELDSAQQIAVVQRLIDEFDR